jgi:cytoskeleton-associated protein 5
VLSAKLSAPVQTYVRRMLEQRRAEDHPCELTRRLHRSLQHHGVILILLAPSRHDTASPIRSPARPDSVPARAMARKSFGPRPSSVAIDKSAPVDEQISHIKNIFSRGGAGSGSGSGSGMGSFEASASPPGQGQNSHGRPLSEISPPGQNLDVD